LTYSPLVALHVATQHPNELERDGVVWCVNFVEANKLLPPRLKGILDREHSQTLTIDDLAAFATLDAFDRLGAEPFVVFLEPPSLDERIANQFSLFSMMAHPAAQLDAWLGIHPELVRRVTVPARLKWEVRDKLDQANINERTLFPGLEGLSRWLARYYLPRGRVADQKRDAHGGGGKTRHNTLDFTADDERQPLSVAAYTGMMANSNKMDRAQHKSTGQRNRIKDVRARAKKRAKKRRGARASRAAAVKAAQKTPPASSNDAA
jgi:hypothetical protein